MTIDAAMLAQWIGRSESSEEILAPFAANAFAATLDRDDPPYVAGSELPPLWHWMHFLPINPMSRVGADGHPQKGGFLPPVPLPRRMWAGSRLTFHHPLILGESARKTSTIAKVEHKSGRSGDLVFVTVRHETANAAGLAISEEQDIVYRPMPAPGAAAPAPAPAPERHDFTRAIHPDPVLLFRYSALTFNSHRIHYDHPYVTAVEGYPGLVVHGPMIATMLLDGLRRARPEARIASFAFRALGPIFDIDAFAVSGAYDGEGKARLWASKTGALCMDATATFT